MKICFVASSGGHLEEINQLKGIAEKYDNFLVTEQSEYQSIKLGEKKYFVRKTDRKEKLFLIHFIKLFFQAAKILKKEKPDLIISTGALITYPFCLLGKFMKIKSIYIESFARVNTPSMTGKLMHPIANLFIVQSEELLQFFPNAVYGGSIF